MLRPIEMAHWMLREVINVEDVVVDATMGNGYDTLFLTALSAHVFAFDVQEFALSATKKRLMEANQEDRAQLILDGHENLAEYVKTPVKAAIFNLGYLPQTDKSIVTEAKTTLTALSALMEKLVQGGRIAIMIYSGHEGGEIEKNAILNWAKEIPQAKWHVFSYAPMNQIHTPPMLIVIEKR
jgi:16S rRNA C1402 N4-methylase RsmH